jgi:hypothetical protein
MTTTAHTPEIFLGIGYTSRRASEVDVPMTEKASGMAGNGRAITIRSS